VAVPNAGGLEISAVETCLGFSQLLTPLSNDYIQSVSRIALVPDPTRNTMIADEIYRAFQLEIRLMPERRSRAPHPVFPRRFES
jgi:hypothetical protein